MSQIARVLVVVNLFLAAGFVYAAGMFLGAKADWMAKHADLTKKHEAFVKDREKAESTFKSRIEELLGESRAVKEAKATLEGTYSTLTKSHSEALAENKTKDAALAKEQGLVSSANENLRRAQDELKARTDEADKLRNDARTAADNERKANEELDKARAEIVEKSNTIAELEKTRKSLTDEVAELRIVERLAVEAGVDISAIARQPAIADARVTAVDHGMKLVQVNVGKEQKLSRGAYLDIVRGSSYVGRIKIDQVYPNTAAGTIQFVAGDQSVQVGDRATNTLN